jgi:hypothetical protein
VSATGPACGTVQYPPGIYEAAFASGAMDSNNALAGFSARGPVLVDGSNRLKPNLVAPGVGVRSALSDNDSAYASYSGSPSASAHVAGAVALLWSAHPHLAREITPTRLLLQNSANPQVGGYLQGCGGIPATQIPNNNFGYGRLDALAAVLAAGVLSPTPTAPPPTATATASATATPVPTLSPTAAPTLSPPATPPTLPTLPPSATPTAPPPCAIQFSDVDSQHPFYTFIRCLACRGVVSGYADGTFRPGADVTRGQLAKILASAASLQDPIPAQRQTFADVPGDPNPHPFWLWVERLATRQAVSGYTCGGPGEPCDGQNRPYFRPGASATRGQIAKITALVAQVGDPVPSARQTFADVPPTNAFWWWIEQLSGRGIISGYTCGGPGEPCVPPQNRPYFRWGANTTRGQLAKIAAQTFYPGCAP